MPVTARVRLFEVEPELGRFLDEEDRAGAYTLAVPVRSVRKGTEDVTSQLEQSGAFAAILLEGMLLQELRLGERAAIRLLGPGDILSVPGPPELAALDESQVSAGAPTRLALLGRDFLAATRRWPALAAGVHVRVAQQSERLAAQLVICQIPRVEDRLISLMWLLAQSWGRVTINGTVLPITLTHGTLGALIGARRPTVTLALGELTERGAIVGQDHGWLLVEGPPSGGKSSSEVRMPTLSTTSSATWAEPARRQAIADPYSELKATVSQLRDRHQLDVLRCQSRMKTMRRQRERWRATRARIQRDRVTRRSPTPSS